MKITKQTIQAIGAALLTLVGVSASWLVPGRPTLPTLNGQYRAIFIPPMRTGDQALVAAQASALLAKLPPSQSK